MKLVIVPVDKVISINGEHLGNIREDLSWIPSDVHAVQWYETWGEIEYNDGRPNEKIEDLGIFNQAVTAFSLEKNKIEEEKNKIEEEELERLEELENSRDYWEEFRMIRNKKLTETDWTQLPDNNLTEEQKQSWTTYRQYLRDLPSTIQDPKPLVLDFNHSQWTLSQPSQGT
tara:strand:+ start:945 stop:1460 length:516 start_codon:yes stop_codon:yes gene_type:complete